MAWTPEQAREAAKKSKRKPAIFSKKFCDIVTPEEAEALVRKMVQEANNGNIKALELCVAYILGKPNQSVDITTDGEKITASLFMLPDGTQITI